MSVDTTSDRSRRSILAGAVGGLAALVVGTLSRPLAAAAADVPLLVGTENSAASSTGLSADLPSSTSDALHVVNSAGGIAVSAQARHSGGVGLHAEGSLGVEGISYHTTGVGVFGGESTGSALGRGVEGYSSNGWGVFAATTNGQALRVDGRATFSRAGRTTITYPNSQATVPVAGTLSTSTSFPERPSLALAMLQTDLPGVYVRATTLDVTAGTLTIWLNAAPGNKGRPGSIDVGWFIVN